MDDALLRSGTNRRSASATWSTGRTFCFSMITSTRNRRGLGCLAPDGLDLAGGEASEGPAEEVESEADVKRVRGVNAPPGTPCR
jgi:hypothetical protein